MHVDELLHARILPKAGEGAAARRRPPVVQHHHKLDTVFAERINANRGLQKHFDAWKLHRLERESAGRHAHHLLCSPGDADILRGRYPDIRSVMLHALQNVRPSHLLDPSVDEAWAARPDHLRDGSNRMGAGDKDAPWRHRGEVVLKGGALPIVE